VPHLQGKYVTDLLVEEAERLIETTAQKDENPMFMLLSHLGVHAGNPGSYHEYPEEDIERFSYIGDENRRKFAGTIIIRFVWK
jgi:arylsulfatase B